MISSTYVQFPCAFMHLEPQRPHIHFRRLGFKGLVRGIRCCQADWRPFVDFADLLKVMFAAQSNLIMRGYIFLIPGNQLMLEIRAMGSVKTWYHYPIRRKKSDDLSFFLEINPSINRIIYNSMIKLCSYYFRIE